jgi:aconitate hydratase 2/2-methylisocitrate dehydratase
MHGDSIMLESYFKHETERQKQGIPPLPLNPEETREVCKLLENPPAGEEELLLNLLRNRVSPGVDPSAKVKAAWLTKVAKGEVSSPLLSKAAAVFMLGTMLGGYNIGPLLDFLEDKELAGESAEALKHIILVYSAFDKIVEMSERNRYAKEVLTSWADGDWFLSRPKFPERLSFKVFKIDGEVNTDDLSPAKHAWSRPDIPFHALSMGETRFPEGIDTIRKFRKEGHRVAFVAGVVGTGSSRKSATNSLLWHIGENIPYVPNKHKEGIVIGSLIAPIFFNTLEDSGGLPLVCDVAKVKTGDILSVETKSQTITDEAGEVIASFEFQPATIKDEYRAGGRLSLIIGRSLTAKAREVLGKDEADFFTTVERPAAEPGQGYSLAQKIVDKACDLEGILPGTACEAKMTTVGSQDTTGPMTADELKELACMEFQADLFMQSFCHTAAYPKPEDVKMHKSLAEFITERKGVVLRPGDGIIHSWMNRFLVPDTRAQLPSRLWLGCFCRSFGFYAPGHA